MTRRFRRRRRRRFIRRGQPEELLALGIIAAVLVYGFFSQITAFLHARSLFVPALIAFGLLIGVAIALFVWRFIRMVRRVERRERRFRPYYNADLKTLVRMDPFEFEVFVGRVFFAHGYRVVVTKQRADEGIDLMMKKDSKRYAGQVKKYGANHPVKAYEVREFYGSFSGEKFEKGFFVTTSGFTRDAQEWAAQRPIELIDGQKLLRLTRGITPLPWHKLLFGKFSAPAPEPHLIHIVRHDEQGDTKRPSPDAYKKFWPKL